jgi:HemX protein
MIDVIRILWLGNYLVPLCYLVTLGLYVALFVAERPGVARAARPMLVLSVTVNLVYIAAFTAYFEHIPLVTVHQVCGGIGFAVAVTYLWVENQTKTRHTGPFVLALVALCQVVSSLHPRLDRAMPPILDSLIFSFHVSAAVLGYSAFALAAIYGLIYLLLYKQMRVKHFGIIYRRLPPLLVLDRMTYITMLAGMTFTLVAMTLGAIWTCVAFGGLRLDPKLIVGFATLVLYGFALAGRRFGTWHGPRLAYSSLAGFSVLVGSMLVVNFFLTRFHMFA